MFEKSGKPKKIRTSFCKVYTTSQLQMTLRNEKICAKKNRSITQYATEKIIMFILVFRVVELRNLRKT